LTVIFAFLGSSLEKALSKTLVKLTPALRPSVTCGDRDEWCEVYGDGDDDGGGHGALQCHLVEKIPN